MKTLFIILCVLGVATAAYADPREQAKAEYTRGKTLFDQKNFAGARLAFENAQRLAPSPVLYYNIALCHEGQGQLSEALEDYRRYLAEMPAAKNRAEVESRIRDLESKLAAGNSPPAATGYSSTGDPQLDRVAGIPIAGAPVAEAAPAQDPAAEVPPPLAPGPPPPAPEPAKTDSGPFYTKWWFWVIAGVGAIVVIDIAVSSNDDNDRSATVDMAQTPVLLRW